MRLFHTPASPFTRKVVVTARELGLDDRLEVVPTTWPLTWATETVPFSPGLVEANPVGRIPALVTDDGMALCDSTTICQYLDSLATGPVVIPRGPAERWSVMALHSIADGALEAMIAIRAELLRPEARQSSGFVAKHLSRIARCLDACDAHPALGLVTRECPVNLGQIALGCACGYADWRDWLPDFRPGRPNLAAWFETFSERPAMRDTVPRETPTQ